jgi:hypothetical protein
MTETDIERYMDIVGDQLICEILDSEDSQLSTDELAVKNYFC